MSPTRAAASTGGTGVPTPSTGVPIVPTAPGGRRPRRWVRVIVVASLVAIFLGGVGFVVWFFLTNDSDTAPEPTPSTTESATPTPTPTDSAPSSQETDWLVDTSKVIQLLSEYRFTHAWDGLTVDSFPSSSAESKAAFLEAVKTEDGDRVLFDPLALIAMLNAWDPGLLESHPEIQSWKDLVVDAEAETVLATQEAKDMTNQFIDLINSDDRFVWFGEADASWLNSGSDDYGMMVVNATAGLTGNRLGWFVRTAEQMEKSVIEGLDPRYDPAILQLEADLAAGQLARCGNPVWVTAPPGVPVGETDEPKPTPTPTPPPTTSKPTPTPTPTKSLEKKQASRDTSVQNPGAGEESGVQDDPNQGELRTPPAKPAPVQTTPAPAPSPPAPEPGVGTPTDPGTISAPED